MSSAKEILPPAPLKPLQPLTSAEQKRHDEETALNSLKRPDASSEPLRVRRTTVNVRRTTVYVRRTTVNVRRTTVNVRRTTVQAPPSLQQLQPVSPAEQKRREEETALNALKLTPPLGE